MNIEYLKTAVEDYRVAAVTPTSKYTIRKILGAMEPTHTSIVEYGAGDGVITREILKRIPARGSLIAIERNEHFAEELRAIGDARLTIVNDDVRIASKSLLRFGLTPLHLVISGIPFSFFKPEDRESIIRDTHRALNSNGVFVVYQYSLLMLSLLKKYFSKVEWHFEPRNIPPYFVMIARK